MGFQSPPQLPDYQKLKLTLTNSGVQQWNPAVYQILFNLIDAVSQSQSVITGTTIPALISEILTSITTIIGGLNSVFIQKGVVTFAQIHTLNSAPIIIVTGVAQKVIIPLWVINYVHQSVSPNGFSGSVSCTLRYDTQAVDIWNFGEIGSNVAITKYQIMYDSIFSGGIYTLNVISGTPVGKGIRLRASSDRVGLDNGDYVCHYAVAYMLADDPALGN